MEGVIYLDNNSTTPLDPDVLEAMLPYLTTKIGNPSNTAHDYGVEAARAVERARAQVAALIGAEVKEIIFTAGATESNNLAILGAARGNCTRGGHIITTRIEHKAVLNPCKQLEREGFKTTCLPVDKAGYLNPQAVSQAITDRTILVSVMAANNEVGTLEPIQEIGRICNSRGVLFHSDAVQALGRIAVDVDDLGVDLLSISAHKMYGPKGVGALFVRSRGGSVQLEPLLYGGGQERGLRSGTVAVPLVVALGAASELALTRLATEPARLHELREQLRERITSAIPSAILFGHPSLTLPGLLSVGFPGIDGDVLIHLLRGVAVSQGSSCSAGSFEPSHVLRALEVDDKLARASIRLGVGRFTTSEEIDRAADLIVNAVKSLERT